MDEVEEGGGKRVTGEVEDHVKKTNHTHIALYLRAYLVLNKWGGEYSSPPPSPLSLT